MTERELFAKIYNTGGAIWWFNHELADGRVESTPELEQWLVDQQKEIQDLVRQTAEFGVTNPLDKDNCATPEYWEWYYRMKKQWEKEDECTGRG